MDANVKLPGLAWADGVPVPRDADGRMVPLSVESLFDGDGKKVTVEEIVFDGCWWYAKCLETARLRIDRFHLSKPDSWESLEEDLDRCIEADCISRGIALVLEDIKQRIRMLRGGADD